MMLLANLRCVLTVHINASHVNACGRSQMYPLFWGEVALGLGLDWTVNWDRPLASTHAVRTHL